MTPPVSPDMLARFEAHAEQAKSALARQLHDDLGGFLVAAVMDTAWAEQNLESTEDARARLKRARKSLAAAVDLKRGMIERLRPTLLDTFGLLAALRWQQKHTCAEAALKCTADLPADEPSFSAAASIALFRIAQEALLFVARQRDAGTVHLGLRVDLSNVRMVVRYGGGALAGEQSAADGLSLWLIDNRVRALGGSFTLANGKGSGVELAASIPAAAVVLTNNMPPAGQAPTPA